MNPLEIQENFSLTTVNCDKTINQLLNEQNLQENDARITYFRKCSQITDTTTMSFDFYQRYLLTRQWWKDRFPNHIMSERNMKNLAESYDQYIRTSYLIDNYSAFESSIRIIIQTYNAQKYEELQRSFTKLIKWFMKDLNRENPLPVFRVFTNIRNSMHSNGLFNPINQKNEEITYLDKKFIFELGKPIPYGGWTDIFSILKITMMEFYLIVNHDKIKSIKFVKEPYSDFWES